MSIFDQNGREVIRILDSQGREIETVYDQNGVIVYTNAVTIIGTSPMQFKALGLPIKDYRIYGETLQDGTPSPDMPVDVVGCGVRTENLFDDVILQNNKGLDFSGSVTDFDGRVTTGEPIDVSNTSAVTLEFAGTGINFIYATFKSGILVERVAGKYTGDVIRTSDCDELYICFYSIPAITKDDISNIMLTTGSTALPYEPYGYKLPVTTTNGTDTITTPIYIGSEPLHRIGEYADYVDYASGKIVRRIKKLVMTEDKNIEYDSQNVRFYFSLGNSLTIGLRITPTFCSHYQCIDDGRPFSDIPDNSIYSSAVNTGIWFIKDIDYTSAADFKSYLAAQYAAGTPVTVWYVLSEPIEEDPPVPFPELPTLSGTNTLTVDTTVKPSEIDLTGRLKASGYGQLLDKNSTAINDSTGTPIFIRG